MPLTTPHADGGQTLFFPQAGITLWVGKISRLMDRIFHSNQNRSYQTLPGRQLGPDSFALEFLSTQELVQVNGFKVQKKQVEWICGRFALKTLVKKIVCPDLPLAEIRISYREQGAPFLNAFPDLTISLSHSHDFTAVGLNQTPGGGLGIDIERIGNNPDPYFMQTAFTPREIHHMTATGPEIFRHWTLKEAFLKYIGMGFHESLHKVEIIDNTLFYQQQEQALTLWSKPIEEGYIFSFVADPPQRNQPPGKGLTPPGPGQGLAPGSDRDHLPCLS